MNNSVENEDDIDDCELEKKNLKSIKEIAQSFCISITKLKKAEIIEKIKSIIKRKREYEKEQKQKQNVNSFNKIIKLTITDNIEPIEILFWKLFRNKTIYKKIFSFMDKQFTITYDSVSSITKLIDSNQFGIIKEKVIRNCRYLYFNSNPYSINLTQDMEYLVKLFSTINQDEDEDDDDDDYYRFYRNFFKIENDYYKSSGAVSCALILSKKLQVFKLFVNEFNYKPTKTDLLHSIFNGSNKFIKYLLELNSPNSFLLLEKECTEVIKDFNHFYTHGLVQRNSFYKGLLCYLNSIGNDNYDRNQYFELLIDCADEGNYEINEKSTLKSLITTARLILKLKTPPPEPIKDEKEDEEEKELSKKVIKPITTIDEIDNFIKKIDKVNLKSLLDDPIIFNNNEIKNFIKKLLILSQPIFYILLRMKEIKEYFERVLSRIIKYKCRDDDLKVLFSHCYDRNKKIKFIDQIVGRNIIQAEPQFQSYFLYLLVIHNDIELVKYYSNKVGNHIQIQYTISLLPPTYYIESIETLEFLFYNQCNYFKDIFYNDYISTYYKNLELLKHFESLFNKSKSLNQLGSGSVSGSDGSDSSDGSGSGSGSGIHAYNGLVSFVIDGYFKDKRNYYLTFKRNNNYSDFVNHFASNAQLYCNDKFRFELLFTTSDLSFKHSINFQTLRNLVINGHAFVKEPNSQTESYSKELLKFMDWIYTNYNNELKNGIFGFKTQRYRYHLLIAIDSFDSNNNNNSIVNKYFNGNEEENDVYIQRLGLLLNDVILLTPYLFEINNLKFLNWFLTIIQKYHNSSLLIPTGTFYYIKNMVLIFGDHIILYSKLQILEYIHQNFNFILKKESDGGILTIKELKSFLFSSLTRDAVKICKFLFQFITITKKEFETYSNKKYNK
ncbi:hypothetical protein DDB_G0271166 [Dictyostelium discoideum AX4]|uniref:Rho termination factor N-terminal domain-containing protein n=1 Tax=Dictyostelium discoideum TaxID=44689 RepID=Q55B45_DICDI|nr:hypothetical protein DDB_G0271166 [Dictyostelium discoideum AX4]EAL71713.1 hypothetical protein DDB_G0271166 [Dictyostelium discoideum AX4]|eukprot:XP_645767.1 hypothetical protein DDB_G0271166 [Dictyostelium discoideum AX4]